MAAGRWISPKIGQWIGWALLALLLASLTISTALDRGTEPAAGPGEATYLMQAESLVRDFDLVYERGDFDRMLLRWQAAPGALALVTGSAGERVAFDRPFPYALWLAPFVALWPHAGPVFANAALLLLAALAAGRVLSTRTGAWTPLWIAAAIFASATFAFVPRASGEIFLLAVTVVGFSLLIEGREGRGRPLPLGERVGVRALRAGILRVGGLRPGVLRAAIAGALLAIPLTVDWLYALLLLAAWWLPAAADRPAARRGLVLGAAAMLAAVLAVQWASGGGLPLAASSFGFTAATGYPAVDFPASDWASSLRHLERADAGAPWDLELRWWSLVDLLLGRGIGCVPYFAPLLLLALAGSARGFRRPIVVAVAVWVAAIVVLRPFDVAGGHAGLANPLFVPFYGASWLIADRCRQPWRWWAGGALAGLVAVLFMGELWRDPDAAGVAGSGPLGGGHQTAAARRLLPYETTQRWRLGTSAVEHGGLRVEAVGEAAWVEARHRRVVVDGAAELVISAPRPLAAVRLDFDEPAAGAVELVARGGRIEKIAGPASAAGAAELRLGGLRRRHAGWWNPRRDYRYVVAVESPPAAGPLGLRLSDERLSDQTGR